MSAKEVKFSDEARQRMLQGVFVALCSEAADHAFGEVRKKGLLPERLAGVHIG